MAYSASARGIHSPVEPSSDYPGGNGLRGHSRSIVETGTVIARIFDLLEGSRLEPFAAEVAWGLVNGTRRQSQR